VYFQPVQQNILPHDTGMVIQDHIDVITNAFIFWFRFHDRDDHITEKNVSQTNGTIKIHETLSRERELGVEPGTMQRQDPDSLKRLEILGSSTSQRERVDLILTRHAWECRITQKTNLFFTSLL
jgi:hypothetical protein